MLRRDFIKGVGVSAASLALLPSVSFAAPASNALTYDAALKAITGGKEAVASKKMKLKAPEIAENGAVVPVTIEVDSPMSSSDYVKSLHILASKNANSRCLDAFLTPANGKAMLSTRIKLGETQDVVAIAELSSGEFLMATQNIKVTIGGCG